MKRIDAIIRPQNLDEVKGRLEQIGVEGFTLTEIRGFGKQKSQVAFRGAEYSIPKLLLTIIAVEEQVSEILDAIVKGARTGRFGDGRIFVTHLDEVVRIRTGEIDRAAS